MHSKLVLLAVAALLAAPALAIDITFQVSEVDLDQDVNTTTAITGSEWLGFGIDINGTSLLLYGPPTVDPFPPVTDNNGVFEVGDNSLEIVFTDPITNLEVDWFSPAQAPSTLTAFNPNGVAIQVQINPGGTFSKTEFFGGTVKRLVVESDPAALCLANLRFEEIVEIPTMVLWGLAGTFLLLLASLAAVVVRRSPTSS